MSGENPFAELFAKAGIEGSGEPETAEIPASEAPDAEIKEVVLGFEKRKGNKVVTSVRDVPADAQKTLMKKLRKALGAGATLTDGLIVFQGDHRTKLVQWFEKNGTRVRGERGGTPS